MIRLPPSVLFTVRNTHVSSFCMSSTEMCFSTSFSFDYSFIFVVCSTEHLSPPHTTPPQYLNKIKSGEVVLEDSKPSLEEEFSQQAEEGQRLADIANNPMYVDPYAAHSDWAQQYQEQQQQQRAGGDVVGTTQETAEGKGMQMTKHYGSKKMKGQNDVSKTKKWNKKPEQTEKSQPIFPLFLTANRGRAGLGCAVPEGAGEDAVASRARGVRV